MVAAPHSYQEILTQIQQLDMAAQHRLLLELTALVEQQSTAQAAHSIREMRGLGKAIWEGIDAQEYVAQERAAWTR